MDPVKVLTALHWDVGDGPQRMTDEEAREVLEFGHCLIEGRQVWPADAVGAGIKLADIDHEWRPLSEPDHMGYLNEEESVDDAAHEHRHRQWSAYRSAVGGRAGV